MVQRKKAKKSTKRKNMKFQPKPPTAKQRAWMVKLFGDREDIHFTPEVYRGILSALQKHKFGSLRAFAQAAGSLDFSTLSRAFGPSAKPRQSKLIYENVWALVDAADCEVIIRAKPRKRGDPV